MEFCLRTKMHLSLDISLAFFMLTIQNNPFIKIPHVCRITEEILLVYVRLPLCP